MIYAHVNVVFQPAGGTTADAIPAANQQVFIDLTAGTMSAARTNGTGRLVSGTGAGTDVPLDDSRTYSVLVQSTAAAAVPPASAGTALRPTGGRLVVAPKIAIRVTNATGGPASGLACEMTIGTTKSPVTTGATGWILSNDQSTGAVTLASATRMLRLSSGSAPAATLALAATPVVRGSTARINISAPAGTLNLHVTEWKYEISDTNPDGAAVSGTITRPASEAPSTVDQFWEGVMCASGTVTARFVAGVSVRTAGAASVTATVVAMDPQTATVDVTVSARSWTTGLTQNPETTFTRAINIFHDTGHHDWTAPAHSVTTSSIASGPNRGCQFAGSTTGVAFTSIPQINADVVNLSSAFQSAQGSVRVLAPPSVKGQILSPPLVTITGSTFSIPNSAAVAAALSLTPAQIPQFRATLCIQPADLLAGTRNHEHLGPVSHKQNCLRALRALEPAVFIEAFIQAPGKSVNFNALLNNRMTQVTNAAPTHNEVDEAATRTAGTLKFVAGSQIPVVNITGGTVLSVWNPATNSPLN